MKTTVEEQGDQITPGPWTWEVDPNSAVDRPTIIVRGTRPNGTKRHVRQRIAYIFTPTVSVGPRGRSKPTRETIIEGENNARLIAHAPMLLHALNGLLKDGTSEDARNAAFDAVISATCAGPVEFVDDTSGWSRR